MARGGELAAGGALSVRLEERAHGRKSIFIVRVQEEKDANWMWRGDGFRESAIDKHEPRSGYYSGQGQQGALPRAGITCCGLIGPLSFSLACQLFFPRASFGKVAKRRKDYFYGVMPVWSVRIWDGRQ